MKCLSSILLLFFIAFLSAPTIVALIEKNSDIAVFYSFSEEDVNKDSKELKANINEEAHFVIFDWYTETKSKIIFENLSKHDNVFTSIFSPPPDFV